MIDPNSNSPITDHRSPVTDYRSPVTVENIYRWLEDVKDPEIPVISVVDLGVITGVSIEGDLVVVEMTPTFVGCPALEVMKSEITSVLKSRGAGKVKVNVTFRVPWTSRRISEKGLEAIKKFGLAPPPPIFTDLDVLEYAQCPRCNGANTEMRTPFGSTLCRAIHYCNDCHEAFEQFKPL